MKIAAATVDPIVNNKVAVSLFLGNFDNRLLKAKTSGFDGIELLVGDPLKLDAETISTSVKNAGLKIAAIGTGLQASVEGLCLISNKTEIERKALSRFKNLIDFASQCNCPIVTLGSFRGILNETQSNKEKSKFETTLKEIVDYASDKSVSIGIEPLNRYENNYLNVAFEVTELIEKLNKPNIGLLLDTFHMNIEETSIEKTILSTAPHIIHVHIGDSNRLPPGKGHFNFQSMIKILKSIEYGGWLSAELLAKPDADTAGRETAIYLKDLLKSI